jgi:phosphatidylserine decarboxylase
MNYVYIFLIIAVGLYLVWRFHYFFRDPEREVPKGKNIVSAADGTVVYVRKVSHGEIPISIKKRNPIKLTEVTLLGDENFPKEEKYIVGIFMHPTSVHVNRSPISGKVVFQKYIKAKKNLPMTAMWFRTLLHLKPYEALSTHILENERNIIQIVGDIFVTVVQIADIYVNKIDSYIQVGDVINKGQRVGMIKIGSQVDMIFPVSNIKIVVKEGQKVLAGESIIATY